jgi:hypothetical protein
MHESALPSAIQPDVASMATRIMSERDADYSDDYAALLDRLVRSTSGKDGCGRERVEAISPIVEPRIAT